MTTLADLGPSPEHAQYQALLPAFWQKVRRQEADMVQRGLPAQGFYDFARAWFAAWANQSVDELRACMADNCSFIDSSTFQQTRGDLAETLANCAACFEAFPDMVFYPQDGTNRSLPYPDYFEGQWRVTIPWRGIARWTGPMRVPGTDIVFAPTGRCLNFIGVDRYTVADDFKISHIDTDWDMAYMAIQLAPVTPPAVRLGQLKAASVAWRALAPALRFLGRNATPDGHRRFDLPLPRITSREVA